jgi:hypothetical protein
MIEHFRRDTAGLALLGHEVLSLPAAYYTAPTPCGDWNVMDLVRHMYDLHEAVAAQVLSEPGHLTGNPVADFPRFAARWVVALEQAGDTVHVPMAGTEVPVERVLAVHLVDVLVHPESIVHGLVEYADGGLLAQMGAPDMRTPIAHALGWPERLETSVMRLDLAALGKLSFFAPDSDRFPALRMSVLPGDGLPAPRG